MGGYQMLVRGESCVAGTGIVSSHQGFAPGKETG